MPFDFMEFFTRYTKYIVLVHVLSATIWMGGMATLTVTTSHLVHMKPLKKDNLRIVMSILKRFFYMAVPLIFFTMLTAVIMQIGFVFETGNPIYLTIVHTNFWIWLFMFLIFIYAVRKRHTAKKHYEEGNFEACRSDLIVVLDYLFVLAFFLGVGASYFGLILRGL